VLDPDFYIMQQSHGLFAIAKLLVFVSPQNDFLSAICRGHAFTYVRDAMFIMHRSMIARYRYTAFVFVTNLLWPLGKVQ